MLGVCSIFTRDTIFEWIDRIRSSLWFIPGLIALAAFVLAWVTPVLDQVIPSEVIDNVPVLFSGRPVGARAVLTTIATAMITTAGLVFSMTVVSLQLASSQFGPRLLRTFIRDRGNQIVFGTFLGIFLYCILVLPTIDSASESIFVPRIAVSVALVLSAVGLAMLVYFIDHVAQSIHADAVMDEVGRELMHSIETIYPEHVGEGEARPDASMIEFEAARSGDCRDVCADSDGFLRFVNGDRLIDRTRDDGLVIEGIVSPGRYVMAGDPIARVWPAAGLSVEGEVDIRRSFVLGTHRTTLQDVSFGFEQLAEMAVRALSPGINDPTTGLHGLNRIGSGLARLVRRELPDPVRRDADGSPRVLLRRDALEHILSESVEPIVRCAGPHLAIWERTLEMLGGVHDRAMRPADVDTLRSIGARTLAAGLELFETDHDIARLRAAGGWLEASPAAI